MPKRMKSRKSKSVRGGRNKGRTARRRRSVKRVTGGLKYYLDPPPPRPSEPNAGTRWFYAAIAPAKGALDRTTIKGWHRVSSISYVFITNGEITLLLEEGEVVLHGGDLLVMRNAMHTWHNATGQPVGMLIAQYPLT